MKKPTDAPSETFGMRSKKSHQDVGSSPPGYFFKMFIYFYGLVMLKTFIHLHLDSLDEVCGFNPLEKHEH